MLLVFLTSCSNPDGESTAIGDSASTSNGNSSGQNQPGVITAGEWNDLDNWDFWNTIVTEEEFKLLPQRWSIYNNNRIAVHILKPDSLPVINAIAQLKRNGTTIFTARTDNKGKAELWVDLFQNNTEGNFSNLQIDINNGTKIIGSVKPIAQGVNKVVMASTQVTEKIEISFVVDATGSMGDELEYLKTELLDVIARVKLANPAASVATSSVFYRDEGDSYVTRVSPFTTTNSVTTNFIQDQSASGGGDFPEAVHSALNTAINELQWSNNAKTRILFLVLDAPPHHNNAVIQNLQNSILTASEKGIKIIPITASGIDKETEFLMRFMAISTNGTYVFITDDSGIGNSHLQASVGQYEVEFLNNLMVRLINKYTE
jgi:hypothetical protein